MQVKHHFLMFCTPLATGSFQLQVEVEEQKVLMLVALDRVWYANSDGHIFRQAYTDDVDYPYSYRNLTLGLMNIIT